MSTKTQTNTQNSYNANANKTYNTFQPALMSGLMQMAQNPLGSSYFQTQAGIANAQANALAQRNTGTLMRNLRTGGGLLSNSAAFTSALAQRGALAASGMHASAFQSALNGALANRNFALASMEGYQPLQTGSNTTQTQSGLGTWLPQIAGMALGAAMPGISSKLGGGSFMDGYRGGGPQSVLNGATPRIPSMMQNLTPSAPPPIDTAGMSNAYLGYKY